MLNHIYERYNALTPSERRLADVVLADPEAVPRLSTGALARAANVSEPTVVRFCRALGCSGVREFKLQLTEGIVVGRLRYARREVSGDDRTQELSGKVIDGAIASLVRLREQLDGATLERAIASLGSARRVEFYGLGGNAVVAQDAQLKFSRLGLPSVAYADAYIHTVAAGLLDPHCVVVAISNTGRSRDMLHSVEIARRQGAKVIAITAHDSPLARQATLALGIDGDGQDPYAPIKARLAPMVVIDILAIGLALRRGPETLTRLAGLRTLLQDKFITEQ